MPIDVDMLRSFRIPQGRQTLDPRDIAAYGLSIGMGQAEPGLVPLDFVDPLRGPRVMPSMVLVMAHPGFWMSDPASGIDPAAVLHMDQSFEILTQVPGTGEVTSRSSICEIADRGPGRAAIVKVQTELSDSTGHTFARLVRSVYIRGGGGFGGEPERAEPETGLPESRADRVVDMPTVIDQALHYRLNGDMNPLHSDPVVAGKSGFDRPILHGLCTMGVIAHALLRELGQYRADTMRSMAMRFRNPVYPGETIRTEIWNDGRFVARVVERDTIVVDRGRATVGDLAISDCGAG